MSPDTSADPVAAPYADLTDPQTLNLYSYVRNNPLRFIDVDGHMEACTVTTIDTTNTTYDADGTPYTTDTITETEHCVDYPDPSDTFVDRTPGPSQPPPQTTGSPQRQQTPWYNTCTAKAIDGSRWAGRLAALKPSEDDAVKFDIALTVSAMRYISDLRIGRVNPEHLNFRVDVAERRYDLPEFLRDHVIHDSNLIATLEKVEPPYPGYQRTIRALAEYRQIALTAIPLCRRTEGGVSWASL